MDVAIAIRTGVTGPGAVRAGGQPAWWPIPCPSWNGGETEARHAPLRASELVEEGLE